MRLISIELSDFRWSYSHAVLRSCGLQRAPASVKTTAGEAERRAFSPERYSVPMIFSVGLVLTSVNDRTSGVFAEFTLHSGAPT